MNFVNIQFDESANISSADLDKDYLEVINAKDAEIEELTRKFHKIVEEHDALEKDLKAMAEAVTHIIVH